MQLNYMLLSMILLIYTIPYDYKLQHIPYASSPIFTTYPPTQEPYNGYQDEPPVPFVLLTSFGSINNHQQAVQYQVRIIDSHIDSINF